MAHFRQDGSVWFSPDENFMKDIPNGFAPKLSKLEEARLAETEWNNNCHNFNGHHDADNEDEDNSGNCWIWDVLESGKSRFPPNGMKRNRRKHAKKASQPRPQIEVKENLTDLSPIEEEEPSEEDFSTKIIGKMEDRTEQVEDCSTSCWTSPLSEYIEKLRKEYDETKHLEKWEEFKSKLGMDKQDRVDPVEFIRDKVEVKTDEADFNQEEFALRFGKLVFSPAILALEDVGSPHDLP